MTIVIELYWAIIMLVVLHTILQHLLNWLYRITDAADTWDKGSLLLASISLTVFELFGFGAILYTMLQNHQ